MIQDNSDMKVEDRGFYHLSRAWYGKANLGRGETLDEIMIGFYPEGGGTCGEFAIRWVTVGSRPTPRLESFEDSWEALYRCQDLLTALAAISGECPTPLQVCDLLTSCGFKDRTEPNSPYESVSPLTISEIQLSEGEWTIRGEKVDEEKGRAAMLHLLAAPNRGPANET